MGPNPILKKKPVFTLLLFFYCGTTVYCESMAASLGPPFRTRAWAGLQIIRSLLSVSLSLFFITIYMIITLSMVPLSQKRLDFLFFSPFQHPNDSLPHLKMHLWGGNKKSLGNPLKVKGYGRNCPLARDFTTCKVQWKW